MKKYIMFGVLIALLSMTVYADNLFVKSGSNQLWFNQQSGMIQTPYEYCGLLPQEYTYCAEQPPVLITPPETITEVTTTYCTDTHEEVVYSNYECTTQAIVVGYEKVKGANIPIYENTTLCTEPQPFTNIVEASCYNITQTIVTQDEPYYIETAPICETNTFLAEGCETRYTTSYGSTQTPVQTVHQVNGTSFITEFESGLMAEEIYTQSKTPVLDGSVDYLGKFKDKTKLSTKALHYAKKTLNFFVGTPQEENAEVLDVEDRIVALEGAIYQMMVENCAKNKNQYTYCEGLM